MWQQRVPGQEWVDLEIRMHCYYADGDRIEFSCKLPWGDIIWKDSAQEVRNAAEKEVTKRGILKLTKAIFVRQAENHHRPSNYSQCGKVEIEYRLGFYYIDVDGDRRLYDHRGTVHCGNEDIVIDWTQEREETLKQICAAIHDIDKRIGDFLNTKGLPERLDAGLPFQKLLGATDVPRDRGPHIKKEST